MLKTGKRINTRRTYSEELKRKLVEDFEKGDMTVGQISKIYGIRNKLIYAWIYKFSSYNQKNVSIMEIKDSQTDQIKKLEEKVKELTRNVGEKQIMIEYLERMIQLADETYNLEIKKNFNTPHSGGSKPTDI